MYGPNPRRCPCGQPAAATLCTPAALRLLQCAYRVVAGKRSALAPPGGTAHPLLILETFKRVPTILAPKSGTYRRDISN